jgi:predicted XRE-type DNA-binding protein
MSTPQALEVFNNSASVRTLLPVDEFHFGPGSLARRVVQPGLGGTAVAKRRRKAASTTRTARQTQVIPKEPLAREIRRLVTEKGLSQVDAAVIVQDAASQLSLLLSGKLRGFSTERLVRTLLRLGREVELVVRPARSQRPRHAIVTIKKTGSVRRPRK